ncbi:MAG: hypothetical protein ACI8Z9_001250 [Paraglaciecola sp.]|jgi:hypothetical protein
MSQTLSLRANSKDEFECFVTQTERYLDEVVIEGSDQELFIASYLSGHFSLVVSWAELQEDWALEHLSKSMLTNLNTAFLQKELPEEEQKQVLFLWGNLTNSIT